MFSDNDFNGLIKHQVIIEPALLKQSLDNVHAIIQNPFLYLEKNNRFLGTKFIQFPDEQRPLIYRSKRYLCFGKEDYSHRYFATGDDNLVYEFFIDYNDTLTVHAINANMANFTSSYYYFMMAIYQVIAEVKQLIFKNEDEYIQKSVPLFEKIADEFKNRIQALDNYAFANETTYWQMLYDMLIEADLAFYLRSVSLMDYIETGRFKSD